MYFLTDLDRVNIGTVMASNEFLKEIPLTKTQAGLLFFHLCLALSAVPNQRGLGWPTGLDRGSL